MADKWKGLSRVALPEVEDKWRGGEREGGTCFWLALYLLKSQIIFVLIAEYFCLSCQIYFLKSKDNLLNCKIFIGYFGKYFCQNSSFFGYIAKYIRF